MEQSLSKSWVYVGMGALAILGLRWMGSHWFLPVAQVQTAGFSYEMPRPKSYAGSFDLSGREIDREVLSDEELAQLDKVKKEKALAKAPPKATQKLNQAAFSNKKPAGYDSQKLTVQTVDTSLNSGSKDAAGNNSASSAAAGNVPAALPETPNTAAASGSDSADSSQKKSSGEWLTELSTSPTAALISQFEKAHQSGEVSDADFYSVAFTLLTNSNQQEEATGTAIISGDTSNTGFVYLAQEYGKVSTTAQSTIETAMMTYATSAKISGLRTGITSGTTAVVTLALKVLTVAVQSAQGVSIQSHGSTSTISASSLQIFETGLSAIAKGSTSNSSQAEILLTEITSISSKSAQVNRTAFQQEFENSYR